MPDLTNIDAKMPEWFIPREWQKSAFQACMSRLEYAKTLLVEACPGAGKSMFAAWMTTELLLQNRIERVIYVSPSAKLREQIVDDFKAWGIHLKENSYIESRKRELGVSVTYSHLTTNVKEGKNTYSAADAHDHCCREMRTLVIVDEIHHAGDCDVDPKAWAKEAKKAFKNAAWVLCLSGTPWREDGLKIPFFDYNPENQRITSYKYDLTSAIRDGVCRIPVFHTHDAKDVEISQGFDSPQSVPLLSQANKKDANQCYSLIVNNDDDIFLEIFIRANRKLNAIRTNSKHNFPNAGGLIVAPDINRAEEYAQLLFRMGIHAEVVHGEADNPKEIIEKFKKGTSSWLISVQMVSEGVDIPRLALCVYASTVKTSVRFLQVVGRIIRKLSNHLETDDTFCHFYILKHPVLWQLAQEMEAYRPDNIKIPEDEPAPSIGGERSGNFLTPSEYKLLAADGEIGATTFQGYIVDAMHVSELDVEMIDNPDLANMLGQHSHIIEAYKQEVYRACNPHEMQQLESQRRQLKLELKGQAKELKERVLKAARITKMDMATLGQIDIARALLRRAEHEEV
jgi:superfamily II DNA or RNA helicase